MSHDQLVAALEAVVAPLAEEVRQLSGRVDLLRGMFKNAVLSKQEAATYCRTTTRTIDRRVERGLLHPVPGNVRRFTLDELDRALAAGIF